MPGLAPGIHVFYRPIKDVDGEGARPPPHAAPPATLPRPVSARAADVDARRTTARTLVDECLARIADKDGEGARAFLHVDAEAAIEAADATDRVREVTAPRT